MSRKSKRKDKSTKYELEEDGKIINMIRLAYDVIAYSVKKFGVPETCIRACEIEENDYPKKDFVVVLSRVMFSLQIPYRNCWYGQFKTHYDSTKFSSFNNVIRALQDVLQNKAVNYDTIPMYPFAAYMAVICEIIMFLFTANCNLFFEELPQFWADYVIHSKKRFAKSGGFKELYKIYSSPGDDRLDTFFNCFIPIHCIPYKPSSNLANLYYEKERKYFKTPESSFSQEVANIHNLVRNINAWERKRVSGGNVLENPGLGIQPHEQLLRSAIGQSVAGADASAENLQSQSSHETASNRRSSRTERLRTRHSSSTSKEDLEGLKTSLPGASVSEGIALENPGLGIQPHEQLLRSVIGQSVAGADASAENLQSQSSHETASNRRSSRIERLRTRHSSRTSKEDLEGLKTGLLGAASSGQNLPSIGSREKRRDRKISSGKKDMQKKSVSRSSGERTQSFSTPFAGADTELPLQNLPSSSREEARDRKKSSSDFEVEEYLKQLNLGVSKKKPSDGKEK